jgi:hypothetical protein
MHRSCRQLRHCSWLYHLRVASHGRATENVNGQQSEDRSRMSSPLSLVNSGLTWNVLPQFLVVAVVCSLALIAQCVILLYGTFRQAFHYLITGCVAPGEN